MADHRSGASFLAGHPNAVSEKEITKLAKVPPDSRLREPEEPEPTTPPQAEGDTGSPDERIDEAIGELNDSVASELLDLIG